MTTCRGLKLDARRPLPAGARCIVHGCNATHTRTPIRIGSGRQCPMKKTPTPMNAGRSVCTKPPLLGVWLDAIEPSWKRRTSTLSAVVSSAPSIKPRADACGACSCAVGADDCSAKPTRAALAGVAVGWRARSLGQPLRGLQPWPHPIAARAAAAFA